MKTNFTDIDELLVKQLTGEATQEEKIYVQQWLKDGEQNRRYYEHFRLIWEESLHLAATTSVDEEGAWQRFQQRIQQAPRKPAVLSAVSWVRVAAAVILVAGLSWMAWFLLRDNNREIPLATLTSANETKTDTLPDGSIITINKNSSLTWPQEFTGADRPVQLTGEGFFAVKPDKQKPFIVNTGNNIVVEVLGTSFNIRNRHDSTEVIVETGRVQVSWQQQSVTLVAGEKVMIKTGVGILPRQTVNDKLYNYYQSHQFVCEATPLWKLVEALNEAYDAHIVIDNPSLRNEPLTTTFENQTLDEIVGLIQITLNIKVVKENGTILLR